MVFSGPNPDAESSCAPAFFQKKEKQKKKTRNKKQETRNKKQQTRNKKQQTTNNKDGKTKKHKQKLVGKKTWEKQKI